MNFFAQTSRLNLRPLEDTDLPRLVELIGDWDVTQWLVQVPHPYIIRNAEEFHARMAECHRRGSDECFVVAEKTDNRLMGVVGLHPSRHNPRPEELVLGYWLGKPYWGQGFMTEAVQNAIPHAFERPEIAFIASTTDPANLASQNVLRKAGFTYLDTRPRDDNPLRGGDEVMRWQLDNPKFRQAA